MGEIANDRRIARGYQLVACIAEACDATGGKDRAAALEEFQPGGHLTRHYRVRLRDSRFAASFIAFTGAATLSLLAALPIAPLTKAFAVLWVGLSALDACRTLAKHRGANGVCTFRLCERAIEVEDAGGGLREGELRDGSFVSPWLTILRWRPVGALRDRTIVILPDMLDADAFRALRVFLRMP